MIRYAHTNLIARNWKALSQFYQRALCCIPLSPRDLSGEWLDRLTGLSGAHITGEHLLLPGYGEEHPTLELFSYDELCALPGCINRTGFAHIAFEVDDVGETLARVLQEGGGQIGEMVTAAYPGGVTAQFVYATDPEGNIVELQSWTQPQETSSAGYKKGLDERPSHPYNR